ncbi:phytanoyl-CoA dioxygenase family protein [Paenibacillus spongiae]|uniref:Phytanoyl-CoA dioxygenase family protein n=1 Tax=Paenibacillus spongiae TaxID=2909671 RepID=A0ABY5SGE9_9BACL|nr:phytanoyl-CoA dioxygenase family protein [Paenibacillus spongiae]UVI33069.1 phytanoyl-CoA dioxygenase family protein [Paenibacillus spongiae]
MTFYRLTEQQKNDYKQNGYLLGLPAVFSNEEVEKLREELRELEKLLVPGEQIIHIRDWHMKSKWIYDICTHPPILDYVEGILGPEFFMWGTQFFGKAPHSKDTVAWHQDAYYWPLKPHNTVTVWLAFTDVDEANGAMQVIPGTHRAGLIKHRRIATDSILTLELEEGAFDASQAKSLCLQAGQLSLHDDNIVHGSPANVSDRWRIGMTIRYSGINVRHTGGDDKLNIYMMRGEDAPGLNRQGQVPVERYARLATDFHKGDEVVKPKTK